MALSKTVVSLARGPPLFSHMSCVGTVDDAAVGASLTLGVTKIRGRLPTEFGKPAWALVDFMDTSSSSKTVAYGTYTGQTLQIGSGVQPARLPRYVIEVFDFPSGSKSVGIDEPDAGKLYRVTAIGFGPTTDTQVVMQMEFRKDL